MPFEDASQVVHRHPCADPFGTYNPKEELLKMRAHYQGRDAAVAELAAAAARVVRPHRPAGDAPVASGRGGAPRPMPKTRPSRAPPARHAAASGSSGTRPRGRSRAREVVMYQAMCLIAYDS